MGGLAEFRSHFRLPLIPPAMRHFVPLLFPVMLLPALLYAQGPKAGIMPSGTFYVSASAGLARSEDGLGFLVKRSASQWTPMANIGAGYRFNRVLGVELRSAYMLADLKAEGTLLSTNEPVNVTARHYSLVIGPIFHLPLSDRSEVYLGTGAGLLFSNTEMNSPSDPDLQTFTTNIGYMVTIGYARQLSGRVMATMQFDFSDPYGSAGVWEGDLGLLNIGIKYALGHVDRALSRGSGHDREHEERS